VNWAGLLFGSALAVTLIGGAGAAFAQRTRQAVQMLVVCMFGVAGVCFSLGNDFIALVVLTLLAGGVPAVLTAALVLAPVAEPDARAGRRGLLVAAGIVAGFGTLAWLLTRAPWAPAGGQRQSAVEWLGSRLLGDHLLTLNLMCALLGLAGVGAVALLRARRAGR